MVDANTLRKGLSMTLSETHLDFIGARYGGKVRDNYSTDDGRRFIVVTDRISAFDRVLGTLPFKGQVLNRVADFWFDKTRDIAPNHVLSVPDPNAMECIECTPLPVEMIVRAYLTGVSSTSILTAYKRGEREFCGHTLPDGLKPHQALPAPILTPTTKAEQGEHDQNASREQILAMGQVKEAHFDEAADLAMRLFARGQEHCRKQGLILVDTKYEFGLADDGRMMVIDEIHTPDSSRYWFSRSYEARMAEGKSPESFDKEYVRRYLADQGFRGDGPIPVIPDEVRLEAARRYIEACETVMGEDFSPNMEEPGPRLQRNLKARLRAQG
ncbi:MAG: phosphoribosylaminoimidazolesuccinocarboxamide synthase [Myxococcales bacterium]|nr:phosphoribosylaminoimidazolesuccinocarboxamide synthase [Myxococcales bacterium]MDD9969660.1 phosphoribosylaminoimidazolesuccinocarboxamide synthase [Myxococcales bacterium]